MDINWNLKKAGLKATLPRLKVLALFIAESEQRQHLGADEVYKRLLADGEDVGLATIYRVLTQFEQAGILQRHHFEGGKAVFELNQGEHHDHLVCMQCGKVEEFYDEQIEKLQREVALKRGFVVQDHSLYLFVDCKRANCPNRSESQHHPGG